MPTIARARERARKSLYALALSCLVAGGSLGVTATPAYADQPAGASTGVPLAIDKLFDPPLEVNAIFETPLAVTTMSDAPLTQLESITADLKSYLTEAADQAAIEVAEREREELRTAVVEAALSYRGVPYVWGGTTPSGFDCAGFTQWVYRETLGIELPRMAHEQGYLGESVSMDSLLPGDLLFFGKGSGVYHVAIYAGDGEYVHASSGRGRVVRQGMEYFCPTFAKRFI